MTEDGKGKLFRDSMFGNVANGLVVAGLLYAADAARTVDITPLPDYLEPLVAAGLATATGLLTSWATARRKRSSPSPG